MRPALHQFLAHRSALSLLRNCLRTNGFLCESANRAGNNYKWSSKAFQLVENKTENNLQSQLNKVEPPSRSKLTLKKQSTRTKILSFHSEVPQDGKEEEISKSLHGTKESSLVQHDPTDIMKQDIEAANWRTLLEIVRDRRRRSGMSAAQEAFRKVIDNGLDMPTEGNVAAELWDHFIQIGFRDSAFLKRTAGYAVRLKQRTGRERLGLYGNLIGHQLIRSPPFALPLHRYLKAFIPPGPKDYYKLLRLSCRMGRESLAAFESIYKDFPVSEMYSKVVPELCKQGLRAEATKWHYLLLKNGDMPASFHACRPLLVSYAHTGNAKEVEELVRSLAQGQVWFEKDMDRFVRNDGIISREIMNRALGEARGIAPRTLSDSFCARLLATRFFSVDMVISGLQAMGVESLGPISMRELVVRDNYTCEHVVSHIETLRNAGIAPDVSTYSKMVEKTARAGEKNLLRSIIDCDLHPDTFEDVNLQERLLAMYCEQEDHTQMERTIAIILSTVPEAMLRMQRANLLLRCHISLRDRPKVVSILDYMQRNHYPLTPRSSRHFRVIYLSKRRKGVRPAETRGQLEDLSLIINVMIMTLKSGASIPLLSWREPLRRLGMSGLLAQYQNLALWLVDWYTRRPASPPVVSSELQEVQADRSFPKISPPLSHPSYGKDPTGSENSLAFVNRPLVEPHDLLVLFGKQCQQGMIAWGFQAEVKRRANLRSPGRNRLPNPRTHWQWGLLLLKELQDRGVPIQKSTIARACKLRLAQLFNHATISDKIANRRAKGLNDARSEIMAQYRYSAYVREMEEIWGRDLFEKGHENEEILHGPIRRKWSIVSIE